MAKNVPMEGKKSVKYIPAKCQRCFQLGFLYFPHELKCKAKNVKLNLKVH